MTAEGQRNSLYSLCLFAMPHPNHESLSAHMRPHPLAEIFDGILELELRLEAEMLLRAAQIGVVVAV